jgi:starvation-inducible DNA-binding protein
MSPSTLICATSFARGEALASSRNGEFQIDGATQELPVAPDQNVGQARIFHLNQLLTQTIALCAMYRKHHWQVSGPGFYPLHLLFDGHFAGQLKLAARIAARVKILGRKAAAPARQVAESTLIGGVPNDGEDSKAEISRLLRAHEIILKDARAMEQEATVHGDDDTRNLLNFDVIHTHNIQVMSLDIYLAQDNL